MQNTSCSYTFSQDSGNNEWALTQFNCLKTQFRKFKDSINHNFVMPANGNMNYGDCLWLFWPNLWLTY